MNDNFDKITCRELVVVDEQGEPAITLLSHGVHIHGKGGKLGIVLATGEDGNRVSVYDKEGELAVLLVSAEEDNSVMVRDNLTGELKELD